MNQLISFCLVLISAGLLLAQEEPVKQQSDCSAVSCPVGSSCIIKEGNSSCERWPRCSWRCPSKSYCELSTIHCTDTNSCLPRPICVTGSAPCDSTTCEDGRCVNVDKKAVCLSQ